MTEKPGWQQPPVPMTICSKCSHLGLLTAMLTLHLHPEGHKWVCTCGKVFVVVSDAGHNKRLVPRDQRGPS